MMGDDFGDLYADLEAQASSVINSIQNCASVYAELPQEEDADYGNAEKLNEGSLLESDSKKVLSENLGNMEAYGSDSEDDLNIVLNDEDCEGFVVGSGRNGSEENQYDDRDPDHDVEECLGKNGSDKSGFNPNGNGSEGGNGVKNDSLRYSQYKHAQPYGSSFPSNRKGNESWGGSCSSQSVSGNWEVNRGKQQRPLNSLVSHGRHGFSLPWYRTILDINIDAFEEKPWCYPGVDLSDFFNFGFDEDSWKQYCISAYNFGFDEDSWKQYCISAEKIRQQSYMHSRKAIHGLPKVPQPYEVGYEHERIAEEGESSPKAAEMGEGHLKLPKGRAIQVEDSNGDRQPTINLRCPRDWDSDVVIQVNVQDSDDNCSVSCEEGNIRITKDKPLLSKDLNADDTRDNHYSGSGSKNEMSAGSSQGNVRYSQLISESDQMSLDLDNHDDDHVQISEKEDVPEALDTVEMAVEESGRSISKSDQCIIESELSLDDRSHFSPTISYSASDVGTSRDGNYGVCEDSPHPLRTPGPQLQDSGASNTKDTRNSGITNKPGTSQNCTRERSSIWEGHRYLDRNPSPTPGGHSSVDRGRHIGRMDDDYRNAEFSYHRKRDFSSGYNDEMFADRHFCSDYTKHSRGRYRKSTRDETKPQDRRDWNNREHFQRKHFPSGKQNDQYDRRRGFCLVGTCPSINWKSRRSVSAYNFKARDVQWRREGEKILSGKRFNRESYLFDKTNEDFIKERRRRFNSFENRRRDSFDGKHRRGGASAGRESFILGKRFRCDDDPSMGLDRLWCMEIDDEYPNHHQYIHPRSHRESYATNVGRWQDRRPPRIGMFESRFAGRHRRQIYNVEDRNNGWVGRYNDSGSSVDGIVYPDSDVELMRRNYGSQSCVMHETQYESLVRHQDDGLYVDSISCSNRVIPRNDEIRGNHRYKEEEEEEEGMAVGDMNFERHRHKMIGEEIEVKRVDKNSNLIYGDEHGQMAWRCLGPLDLIAEEEKSPGKQSDGGSMLCNGKLEMMDLNFVEDQTNMKNFEETGIHTDMLMNEGDHDDLKWLDKFPVTEHNDDLDIEDGQIITEDPNIEDSLENIYVPDSAAPNHNMEKNIYCETASREDANGGYDDQRILDTMAKMEKRRERFKDTITLKTEPDQNLMAQVDSVTDPVETKMERPSRKRRWGGR